MLRTPLFLLAVLVTGSHGSCFGRDASWTTGGSPVVTQPSRNDPSKVMINWDRIVSNEQCVDKYVVWMWPDGTQKTDLTTIKMDVAKNVKSVIMDVEACVGYRFIVELDENEMRGNQKFSGETLFKTTATPRLVNLDADSFVVGYRWDPTRQVSDLRMASIQFPRASVQHASCLDYVQVTGAAVRPRTPTLARSTSTSSMTGMVTWDHIPAGSRSPTPSGGFGTLPSGRAFTRGTSSTSSGSSTSTLSRGSGPARGPLASTHVSPFGPVETPHYSNSLPRSQGGAAHNAGPVKIQPPFLNPMIEVLIAVQDCAEYHFEVKLFAPRSQEVGKIQNIHLAALADIVTYIPPPVTEVMSITFGGSSGRPVYGVKTSSGVSAACLPAYFEALDSYRQRLENEITYGKTHNTAGGQTGRAGGLIVPTGGQSPRPGGQSSNTAGRPTGQAEEEAALKRAGCICSSPHLEFNSTDARLRQDHAAKFGHFHYTSMDSTGKPIYTRTPTGSTMPRGGRVTTPRPQPALYLFWYNSKKQWLVGPTVGSTSGVTFATTENSAAVCPGDPATTGQWQRKTSVLRRWTKETSVSMACQTQL